MQTTETVQGGDDHGNAVEDLDPARVLVVDDERFFREAIREILAEEGLECIEVEDGERALSLALDPAVGVVILDIRLPGIDGIEVLRRLRELRPALRVIMLSASTDQELVLEALRLGACDYLAKPLHDEELVLAVRRAAESFGVAHGWTQLRGRLDRLVSGMAGLAQQVKAADVEDRGELIRNGAAETAAEVLQAARTSLMLLNEQGTELEVAASIGGNVPVAEMDPVPVGTGVAGVAIQHDEPLVVADLETDDRFSGSSPRGRYASGSFAVAPLGSRDEPLGVLCATDRTDGGTFGLEDAALLRLLAMQISELMAVGRGIERSGLPLSGDSETTLVDGKRGIDVSTPDFDFDSELARLVCDAVVNEVEPGRVIRAALEPLGTGLPAAPVSLYLLDAISGELRLEGEWDGATRSDRPLLAKGRGLTGTVLQSGHLVATESPEIDPRFDAEVDTPEDAAPGPLLCMPLRLRGKIVGVARAFLEEGSRVSPRTGEVLGAALSAAVRNVLLYRSLVESIEEVAEARRQAQPAR